MKKLLLLLIIFSVFNNIGLTQNASTYFPPATGYKWFYKNTPLDSNNVPQTNLATYRIDSFAVTDNYKGYLANIVRMKDHLISQTQNTPYHDTNYYNFQTTNGWKYLSLSLFPDTIPLPGILNFLREMEGWYSTFRFAQTVGSGYTIASKDTTIIYNSIPLPLRAKILGIRYNDEIVNTVNGNYTAKKFMLTYGLYFHIIITDIPILEMKDTSWIAQGVWMVKEVAPSTNVDLSYIGLSVNIPIPGNIYELVLPPIGIRNITSEVPSDFKLYQNYPNPFNPTTKIKFDVTTPHLNKGGQEEVSLKVYDILGKEIQTLVNEQLQPGTYEVSFDAGNFSSGVYYYKLSSGQFSETKKLMLIK